jgi:hypothetical protein
MRESGLDPRVAAHLLIASVRISRWYGVRFGRPIDSPEEFVASRSHRSYKHVGEVPAPVLVTDPAEERSPACRDSYRRVKRP